MELESKKVIDRPLDEVYNLVKNEFSKLAPYLPNVNKVEVMSTEDLGEGRTKIINHWYAKAELPKMMQKFIKPEIFSWKDIANWNDSDHLVEYELESFLANDLFDAVGVNYFASAGEGKTELRITCGIKIYPEKVPGVPRLLAGKVRPMVEGLIEKIIGPNLASLGDALDKYYSEH
ncbi:MAG: hypothetical protein HOE90_04060 [Bacteriovoracaceae bacterium]|jgi:hypothetical protein|nr:hypothetical protein [Bacteriovoracaceae bacterium]